MKPINLLKLSCILLLIIISQSCKQPAKPGLYKDGQIDAGQRGDFHKLNDEVFKYLKANDANNLQTDMSKEFMDDNFTASKVQAVSTRLKNDYTLLAEYYLVNNKTSGNNTIKVNAGTDSAYNLVVPAVTPETYIGFFVPKNVKDEWLITVIYNKYDYGWKLDDLYTGQYGLNGKTAVEHFEQAKLDYSRGGLSNAVSNMEMAYKCITPSGIWDYQNKKQMMNFYQRMVLEADSKFNFPLTMTQVPTHPRIFRIFSITNDNGTFPMIYYVSNINVSDDAALKKENDAVMKNIGNVLPGIDKNNQYIFFSAYNEKGGKKSDAHADFSHKL